MPMNQVIGMLLDGEYTIDPRVIKEAQILKCAGFEVHVLCYGFNNPSPKFEIVDGVNVHRIPVSKKWTDVIFGLNNSIPFFNWFWSWNIKKFISQIKPFALHAHDLYMISPAKNAIENHGIFLVADLHENFPATMQSFTWATRFPRNLIVRPGKWIKLEERLLRYCDRIILLSDEFHDQLSSRYGIESDKFVIFPNVPDLVSYENSFYEEVIQKQNPDDFVFLYIGRVAHRRGIQYVLKAMKIVLKTTSRIRVSFIGPLDKLDKTWFLKEINDPIIAKNIEYIPWKDPSELPNHIKASDAGISPLVRNAQHESGIANKVFQSLMFGKPVIVSDCSPQANLIKENNCGLVYKYDDVEALAQSMLRMASSTEMARDFGANGRQIIVEKYNSENFGKNLIRLYSSLLREANH